MSAISGTSTIDAAPRLARRGDGAQVHLGLAAAGDAVERGTSPARALVRAPRRWRRWPRALRPASPRAARRARRGSAKNGSRGAVALLDRDEARARRAASPRRARCPSAPRACAIGSAPDGAHVREDAPRPGRAASPAPRRAASAPTHCTLPRADAARRRSKSVGSSSSRAASRSIGRQREAHRPRRSARSSTRRGRAGTRASSAGTAGSSSTTRASGFAPFGRLALAHREHDADEAPPAERAHDARARRTAPRGERVGHRVGERARERHGQRDVGEEHRGHRAVPLSACERERSPRRPRRAQRRTTDRAERSRAARRARRRRGGERDRSGRESLEAAGRRGVADGRGRRSAAGDSALERRRRRRPFSSAAAARSRARRSARISSPKVSLEPVAELERARHQLGARRVALEVAQHRRGRRVALVAVGRERLARRWRAASSSAGRPLRGSSGMLGAPRLLEQAVAPLARLVHAPPGGELPEHDARREDVGARVDRLAARVLGAHVAGLALERLVELVRAPRSSRR